MITRAIALTVVAAATLVLSACANSRKSATLDRSTALELIREAPAPFSNAKMEYDAKTREAISHDAKTWDLKRGEMTIAFLDVLARSGVLTGKKASEIAAGRDALGMPYPDYAIYTYSIVSQENVRSMYANTQNEIVLVAIAKPKVKEILGIKQEGTEAVADASIVLEPTPIYDKITGAAKDLLPQCASFVGDGKPYFCMHWPSRENLISVNKQGQFHFTRYDDGWHLVNE